MNNYKKLADVELVSYLKKGDRKAFTVIYDRYWRILLIHARKMLRDEEEASDVVQEVFIYLWNKITVINITSSLAAYLYSSVRHKILNVIKRGKIKDKYIESHMLFEVDDFDLNDELDMRELVFRIEDSIERLPKKMREVFELSRKTNLSHRLISEELKISENTVKKQINRAIKLIKNGIEQVA